MSTTTAPPSTVREKPHTIVVHPLVLLSATDHFYRVARDTQNRRVVGLLLGESFKGRIDITNSFAIVSRSKVNSSYSHSFTLYISLSLYFCYTLTTSTLPPAFYSLLSSLLKKTRRTRVSSFWTMTI